MSASRTGQSKNQTRSRSTGEGHNDLLTQEELAARLRVGLRTLVRLQHDGAVPFIVLGKSVRFYWPAVVSHLNANSTVCVPHGPLSRISTMPSASKGGRP